MVTNRVVWTFYAALFTLASRDDLKRALSVRLGRAIKRLRPEMDTLREEHDKVAHAHAKRDEEGNIMTGQQGVVLEDFIGYTEAWQKVLADPAPIDVTLPTLTLEELPPKLAGTTIEALWALGMLVDPEDSEEGDDVDST